MNIAIIPARGGSKRIPKKNIKLFHGKPMIAYSIEAAIQSGCFDKVIVSTDDQDIADIAIEYGADVPFFRPSNISDDYATTMDVMQHAINWCMEQQWNVETVCCLYATAPFITSDYLIQGYEKLIKNEADFVFSAATFSFPIQRAIKLTEKGEVSMFSPEYEQTRSQDLEEAYHDAGQFYWGKADSFLDRKAMFAKHSTVILLPRSRVQDIDTEEDWSFAELLYSALESE
ncbi:pseudaminic acid cytidylyltransferase [Aliivibrio sp. 1S128]|uniref:pseudaminic acid cytidylyltransferase n=1 Tax=Aliivibrio sp. 1S128 TaxID=1840085 RepID=UPI00080E6A91|nr:pseudaminic acid cytidylyltransferase [Aliivibrio sp. 1S128]OCH25512.1 pseudaminic acid cytidylyltransferase [Aliivibrio sp. 1S128]